MVSALHTVKPQDIFPVLLLLFTKGIAVDACGIVRLYPRVIQDGKKCYGVIVMGKITAI